MRIMSRRDVAELRDYPCFRFVVRLVFTVVAVSTDETDIDLR